MAEKKKMPKGGKKGGTRFPQIPLKQAVEFAKKLVARTHTGPQPETIILKGVFNNSGPTGAVRASALKQFGLLEGEASAYTATTLAKGINSAPNEELAPLLQQALLAPKIFRDLFDTFQNDTVSIAKLRQQALKLGVHPDNGEKCVEMFVASAIYAGTAEQTGEDVKLSSTPVAENSSEEKEITEIDEIEEPSDKFRKKNASPAKRTLPSGPINISLSLDSTMDPEKLEKYLKLLRDYGAIG